MSNVFSRSWKIFKLCLNLVGQDKEMIMFPILSGVFSLITIIVFAIPVIIATIAEAITPELSVVYYGVVFLLYLVLAFITTFFNVALVNTVKTRLEGNDATFRDSIDFAVSRLKVIFQWSMLSATVGLLLKILDGMARQQKGIGRIIAQIAVSMVGLAWSVATVFVIPVLAYEGKGPFAAVKSSVGILKKTWGESLVRYYGMGLLTFIAIAGFILILLPIGFLMIVTTGIFGIFAVVSIGIIGIAGISIISGIVNQVFNIVLYEYATKGIVPGNFDKETLEGAFKSKKKGI